MGDQKKAATAAEVAEVLKAAIGSQALGNAGKLQPKPFDSQGGIAPDSVRPTPRLPRIIDNTKSIDGVMVALMLNKGDAETIAIDGGNSPESLHITLAVLDGKADDFDDGVYESIAEAIGSVIDSVSKIEGSISGVGRFGGDEQDDFYASFNSVDLHDFRDQLVEKLEEVGVPVDKSHGFVPHVTLAHLEPGSDSPIDMVKNLNLAFDKITVVSGEQVTDTYDLVSKRRKQKRPRRRRSVEYSEKAEIQKSMDIFLRSEAGIHKHNLVRQNSKTGQDGDHQHVFLTENGNLLFTTDDGAHEHSMADPTANETGDDTSAHSHVIEMFDRPNLETKKDGRHTHEALVSHTAADGSHTHELEMEDGVVLRSMTAGEFWQWRMDRIREFKEEEKRRREMREAMEAKSKSDDSDVEKAEGNQEERWDAQIDIPIVKADDERREVTGIVLEPDEVDAQNDTVSAEVIKEAAHKFLARFNRGTRLGLMHKIFGEIGVELVESSITDVNNKVGGKKVKKGSWVITVKILDDAVWKKVKDGDITGFSIGGVATVV